MRFLAGFFCGLAIMALLIPFRGFSREHVPAKVQRGFLCIHRHEGAWNANTGNGYYGGLQMDYGFMRTYGTWLLRNVGTADRWRADQQIRVAYRAHHGWKGFAGRGFSPWPNTARECGLL